MPVGFTKDTEIFKIHRAWTGRIKTALIRILYPVNVRWVRNSFDRRAELLYCWGFIPIGTLKPYIIELDTPYVITLYNLVSFGILKPLLRWLLLAERCRGIICISEACRTTLEAELGKAVAAKASVVYPFIKDQIREGEFTEMGRVEFLFVSTQFYLKGGRELLNAFERLAAKYANAHLTLVTNFPEELEERYRGKSWLSIIPANLDKKELHEKHFAKAHVFVMPTYQDSFGMVILEALSFGMPILSTRMYAIPEMVADGANGFLIETPFQYYRDDGKANRRYWKKDLAEYTRLNRYPGVEEDLLDKMAKILDSETRARFRRESIEIFRTRFNERTRKNAFKRSLGIE